MAGSVDDLAVAADQIGDGVAKGDGKVEKDRWKTRIVRPTPYQTRLEIDGQTEGLIKQPDREVPAGVIGQRDAEIAAAIMPYPGTVQRRIGRVHYHIPLDHHESSDQRQSNDIERAVQMKSRVVQ